MKDNMFEVAVRTKMRFPFNGRISVEDLWDLSVENLDSIYQKLNSAKKTSEKSLLNKKTPDDETLDMKIEIVKYIVDVKLNEENEHIQEKLKKDKRDKLLMLIAEKEDAEFKGKTKEELLEMVKELE